MKKLVPGEHYFGVRCVSCGITMLLDSSNSEMTDEGKYRVTCSNFVCKHPTNDYERTEVEHFQATER